jgi:hypothetical protein
MDEQPAGQKYQWLDGFEEQFVSNFTGTYKRPNRPQ